MIYFLLLFLAMSSLTTIGKESQYRYSLWRHHGMCFLIKLSLSILIFLLIFPSNLIHFKYLLTCQTVFVLLNFIKLQLLFKSYSVQCGLIISKGNKIIKKTHKVSPNLANHSLSIRMRCLPKDEDKFEAILVLVIIFSLYLNIPLKDISTYRYVIVI